MSRSIKIMLIFLAILLLKTPGIVSAQNEPEYPYYIVESGDTLSLIAARFRLSVEDILQVNDIQNPNVLAVGTEIRIPGFEEVSGQLVFYTVNLGDNYSILTGKNGFPANLLSQLNQIVSPGEVFIGSRMIMPAIGDDQQFGLISSPQSGQTNLDIAVLHKLNPWELYLTHQGTEYSTFLPGDKLFSKNGGTEAGQLAPGLVSMEIEPLPFVQGKTVVVKIITLEELDIRAQIAGYETAFFKVAENEYVALQGIHAREETGVVPLQLVGSKNGETQFIFDQQILVESGYYGEDPPIFVDPITIQPDVIEPEQELVEAILAPITSDQQWSGPFRFPVDDPCISAYYGGSRVYNNSYNYFHTGIDFNVCKANNINVYAVAPGKVVFAGPLVVRGNTVFIDHGWGVYTGYFHHSELAVKQGDYVQAGDLIGLIGNTGRSTGAHLHLEIWVNGVQVDPLDWLQREYP